MPQKGYGIIYILMLLLSVFFLVMMILVDAFPRKYILLIIGALLLLIFATNFLFIRDSKKFRMLGLLMAVFFLSSFGLGSYYLANTYAMFQKISSSEIQAQGIAKEPFNIYITGIDQWESEKGYDLERSDVNMIVTVSPQTKKILLTSIPRDTYVPLHRTGEMDKLTHTGIYGVDETLNTVEDWLGIEQNYYVKMNFTAVVDIINAMGGIDVYSPVEFTPIKRNWWTVKKGWNHMNGKEALAFARERKFFDGQDDKRVENQQRVVDAILKKAMTSRTILTKYPDILKAASDNMSTNLSPKDMQEIAKMQLEDLGEWDIEKQKIEGEYDLDYVASLAHTNRYSVYRPNEESVEKAKQNIQKIMNPSQKEIEQVQEKTKQKKKENAKKEFEEKITKH